MFKKLSTDQLSLRTLMTVLGTLYIAITFSTLSWVIIRLENQRFIAAAREEGSSLLKDFARTIYNDWEPTLSDSENIKALNLSSVRPRLKNPNIVYLVFQDPSGKISFIPKNSDYYGWMVKRSRLDPLSKRLLSFQGSASRTFYQFPNGIVTELLLNVQNKRKEHLGTVRLGLHESRIRQSLNDFTQQTFWRLLLINASAVLLGSMLFFYLATKLELPIQSLYTQARRLGDTNDGPTPPTVESGNVLVLLKKEFEGVEKLVKRLRKDRTELVTTLSHELRSPMQAIVGYADFLRRGAAGTITPEIGGYLKIIQESAEQFESFIENVLDLARLDGHHLPIHTTPTAVTDSIQSIWALFQGQAAEHDLRLLKKLPEESPKVMADPARLSQILINLVSNAIKFAPPTTVITIGASPEKEFVEFFVQDDGPGIPLDKRHHVFDEFFQVPNLKPLRGSTGLGIGLTLCKRLVEVQGGRIWIDEKITTGTTVRFTLPIVKEPIHVG